MKKIVALSICFLCTTACKTYTQINQEKEIIHHDVNTRKTASNEIESIEDDSITQTSHSDEQAALEAFILEQPFLEEYERLSPKEKAALNQEPSYISTLFEDFLASVVERFPWLEDSAYALIEKYPFLLEWYVTWYEYNNPQLDTTDVELPDEFFENLDARDVKEEL